MSDETQIQKIKEVLGLKDDWRAGLTQCLEVVVMVIETRQRRNLVNLPETSNIYDAIDMAKQLEYFDKLIKDGFTLEGLVQIDESESSKFEQGLVSEYLVEGIQDEIAKNILGLLFEKGKVTYQQLIEINSKSSMDLSDLIK